ncbi:hypothetical protein [Streptomyces sp. NPDC059271]|uniref:hypothetical protein n=1 Tax=Streptomyces sp. NPDC059271 TaxID=3346799 RepID=UPI0036B0897F
MTSLDRTGQGADLSPARYAWLPTVSTMATLATVTFLALTGHPDAAIAAGVAGGGASAVVVKVNVRIR